MFSLSNEDIFNLQHTIVYWLLFINCIALASVQCIAMLAIPVTIPSAGKSNFAHPCVGTCVLCACVLCMLFVHFEVHTMGSHKLHASVGLVRSFHTSSLPCSWTSVYTLFPFHTAEFLDHFRQQFIADVDASAIALELEQRDIISNGDQKTISRNEDNTQQSQLLHACLKKTYDAKALMDVCDVIAMAKGTPRMKSFGERMKTEWEKSVCGHSVCACVCDECVNAYFSAYTLCTHMHEGM